MLRSHGATWSTWRGWLPGMVKTPPSLHLMLSLLHESARQAYLANLAECSQQAAREAASGAQGVREAARY